MNGLGDEIRRTVLGYLVVIIAVASLVAFYAGHRFQHATLGVLRDTVRITDSIEVARWDTVTKYFHRVDTVRQVSDALDTLVAIHDDSTLVVADSGTYVTDSVTVPPLVVADLRALRLTVVTQDTLIHALYQHDTTQQWRIATRDQLIAHLSKRKFPLGIALVAGPMCTRSGCALGLGVGLSYRIR